MPDLDSHVRNLYFSLSGPGSVHDVRFRSTLSYIAYIGGNGERDLVTDPVVEGLIVDLLLWLAKGERTYEEVMDAWRTSCPRLPIWEEANDRGLVTREHVNGLTIIRASTSGLALLEQRGLGQRTSVRQTWGRVDEAQSGQAQ